MPESALSRHLGELTLWRQKKANRETNYQQTRPMCEGLLRVPLVHLIRPADRIREIARRGRLAVSTDQNPPRGQSSPEISLGIPPVVYTSAGVIYPDPQVVIVLSPEVEDVGANATPFDSGWFAGNPGMLRAATDLGVTIGELFSHLSIGGPPYRRYLVEYVASCFTDPAHYMLGVPRWLGSPRGLMSSEARTRAFEVRVAKGIDLSSRTVLAVFFRDLATEMKDAHVARWRATLVAEGVPVEVVDTNKSGITETVQDWLIRHLGMGAGEK